MNTAIIKNTRSFDFPAYKAFINKLANINLSTGELSEDHINATRINAHRIKRIDRQIEIIPDLKHAIESVKNNWEWLILVESWCGDGAQNLPIIAKIAALSENIKLTIRLRDENTELMDAHLTNGSRAIPKLICINTNNQKEIGKWGPRPVAIQEKVKKLKANNPLITHSELSKNLHLWYAKDKGLSLQNEFIQLINEWTKLKA